MAIIFQGNAQGFDWQYSPRMPAAIPRLFVGAGGEFKYYSHFGNLNFYNDIQPSCCTFKNGFGSGYTILIEGEYWQRGDISIFGGLSYNNIPGQFTAQESLPRNKDTVYNYEYVLNTTTLVLSLEVGAKYRLFESHFNIGGSLQFGFLISNTLSGYERILDPESNWFPGQPDPHRWEMDGYMKSVNRLMVTPSIKIGYDLDLGRGKYASIISSAGYSLISIVSDDSWNYISIGFGVVLFRAIE